MTAQLGDIDPRVLLIAHSVRCALEQRFPRRKTCRNLCTLSACAIVSLAQSRDIDAKVVAGVFTILPCIPKPQFGNVSHINISRGLCKRIPHAWVKHRANYIDITLTQFSVDADKVALLPIADTRYRGNIELLDFAKHLLPFCGSSLSELEAVIDIATGLLEAA